MISKLNPNAKAEKLPSVSTQLLEVNEDYFKEDTRQKSMVKGQEVEDVYKSFKAGEQISAQQERTKSEDNFRGRDMNALLTPGMTPM